MSYILIKSTLHRNQRGTSLGRGKPILLITKGLILSGVFDGRSKDCERFESSQSVAKLSLSICNIYRLMLFYLGGSNSDRYSLQVYFGTENKK